MASAEFGSVALARSSLDRYWVHPALDADAFAQQLATAASSRGFRLKAVPKETANLRIDAYTTDPARPGADDLLCGWRCYVREYPLANYRYDFITLTEDAKSVPHLLPHLPAEASAPPPGSEWLRFPRTELLVREHDKLEIYEPANVDGGVVLEGRVIRFSACYVNVDLPVPEIRLLIAECFLRSLGVVDLPSPPDTPIIGGRWAALAGPPPPARSAPTLQEFETILDACTSNWRQP